MQTTKTNSQIAIRQMSRNFERISQLLRESGHENRAFEYALIANRIDEKLSYITEEDWKSIVLNDGPNGKEIARLGALSSCIHPSIPPHTCRVTSPLYGRG